MSTFIKESIAKKLIELRYQCGLQRLHVRGANVKSWGDGEYWERCLREEKIKRPIDRDAADKALAGFIAEHRAIMGPDWIGNDHGRLCWSDYLGGAPIDQHYCQKPEGHEGPGGNEIGVWPQGIRNGRQWHELLKTLPKGATGLETPEKKAA